MYDYKQEMAWDVIDYIHSEMDKDEVQGFGNLENMAESLEDRLFVSGVTGNDNGSYFCNAYKAHEALYGNEDLAREAYSEFGNLSRLGEDFCNGDYEGIDVSIRCYLLSEVIHSVIFEDMADELEAIMNEENDEEEEAE